MNLQRTIRNLPEDLRVWLEKKCRQKRTSTHKLAISILRRAKQALEMPLLADEFRQQERSSGCLPFTFADLFAGIGGFRIALEALGGKCVISCEKDPFARQIYEAWFGELPHKEIREMNPENIPDHDLLAAAFPCQPFSAAGVSKGNSLGRPYGIIDPMQGNLFFHLAYIIAVKRPPILFLENVRDLQFHDRGHTWQTIRDIIEGMDYVIFAQVIDACGWVPQHWERIYIVCFDQNIFGGDPPFAFPEPPMGKAQKIVVSDTPVYRQFGNAVVPEVIKSIGKQIQSVLAWHLTRPLMD